MADPASYRPAPGQIPDQPGVYRFRDESGRVIYVGKAKSLRHRLNSYFQDIAGLHQRTATMVTTASSVDWVVVQTEVEALALEYSWIKEFEPRFNVRYRDDKSYPYLALTMDEEYPRVLVLRGSRRKGVRYFGPYAHAWAIRETMDLLLRVFPMRSCSAGVFKRAAQVGRPCLLGYIDKCSAPCVGRVSAEEHRTIAEDFAAFMAGRSDQFIKRLHKQMGQAAQAQDYELAARIRDDIAALERAMEKNAVVFGDGTDADVIALFADPLEAAVQIFHVRGGRIRGERGFVVDRVEDLDEQGLMAHLLQTLYGAVEGEAIPKEVLVNVMPTDSSVMKQWLGQRRGSQVDLRVPARGDKVTLMQTVVKNAEHSLAIHKTKRASDLTTRSQALNEIQDGLNLADAPLRIECIDISNLQGTDSVASLVVFEDGLPKKSDYRRFIIKSVEGASDVASIREVVLRRFKHALQQEESSRRFAYPPQLLMVDGGAPQVAAAIEALTELGIVDLAVCGLAKRLEEVWLPGAPDPVILPRQSEGLYMLQRIRDEAHRFAISHHRTKRSTSMVNSLLDNVPGLGEIRRKALMRRFGSLKRLRAATVEEIAEVPGIGMSTAAALREVLDRDASGSAVNVTTGEIVDD